ncbi:Ribosomal lysine N-methyltransferase 4 [Friedmanniomyces endolithicus]|uniref:Ribosomal lysine N-methyltransferase 4 n=1 Tax=Friedmanniomyces endolithicus TaxID=329885 RepID=A0AAN6K4X9_9PEZI|nr:Ribosomal lysine N-methyltransferase 4 [Friedmanniomyces endolithicus]KAK0775050.1 Ribosomal lysine N-methyltransferase 4 [Friedmanniomyces endolithicus]KAK0781200.1 Ribosomal lysine N-methyltransferase 4 [Friedmanniomyces endolithicus]KAK0810862.1 Ribosomal lysine N-methyltransferase 4 [Friedmanniomyces endolithicus]KAK0830609.1 Ribosomal lysine N-methyltransferase 4 [Friedmanniomyces endolithicus]
MASEDVSMTNTEDIDDFEAKSRSFVAWLQRHGTVIELADLRRHGAGRGVLAKEDIAEDEELFAVPRSSILTISTSNLPAEVKTQLDEPWLGLIAAMVYEYQRSSESMWEPYFAVLPVDFDTPMFWSDDELNQLRGSALVDKIGKPTADRTFREQVIPMIRQHATAFHVDGMSDDDLVSLCHRMGSTIMAYAFDLEKPSTTDSHDQEDGWEEDEEESESMSKGMIPLADMLNADANRNNAKLYYEEDKVVMKSIRAIKAAEEIFNDYGPLPTADVLRRYGYVTSNYAQYDVVEVSLQLIKDVAKEHMKMSDEDLEHRTRYLDDEEVLDDCYDISRSCNEDTKPFSDELCILLSALALPAIEFENLQRKRKLPRPALEPSSAGLLSAVLHKRQGLYKGTTNQDNGVRGDADPISDVTTEPRGAHRRKMAQQVIQGEQLVLVEALALLKEMSAPTGGKRKAAEADTGHAGKKQKS